MSRSRGKPQGTRKGGSVYVYTGGGGGGSDTVVDLAQCTLSVIGGGASVASGSAKTLRLQLKNAAGTNLTNSTGITVTPTKVGGTATGTLSSVTNNGDGTFDWTYTGVLAGTAQTLGAQINAVSISATASLSVVPGPFSLSQSVLTVSPSSLAAGSGAATATLQGKDAAGNLLVADDGITKVISVAAGGASAGATSYAAAGQWICAITANTEDATPRTISATSGGQAVTSTTTFTTTAAFATPNILNRPSFSPSSWGGFTNGSLGNPSNGGQGGVLSRVQEHAYGGGSNYAVKRVLPVTDGTGLHDDDPAFYYWRPGGVPMAYNRWYSGFYFAFDGAIGGGTLKMQLHFSDGLAQQLGGFYLIGGKLKWVLPEQLASGAFPTLCDQSAICDGNLHCLESDYYRNGDTSYNGSDLPSVAWWLDGNLITPTAGLTNGNVFSGGRYYTTTPRVVPTTVKLGVWAYHGNLNSAPANPVQRNAWFSYPAISTLGRVGP